MCTDSIHSAVIDIEDINEVPAELIGSIIPPSSLSVGEFLGFNMPSGQYLDEGYPINEYIVQESPPPLPKPELLRWLPVPTRADVRALSTRYFKKDPISSISIPGSGIVFPLTIIPFWEELWKARDLREKWDNAMDWLWARTHTIDTYHHAEWEIMSSHWEGPEAETILKLFSEEWMEGAQLNTLLGKISSVSDRSDFLLVMTEFISLLKADHDHRGDLSYKEPKALQMVVVSVLEGKRWVLGILNISNTHWTAYAISVRDGRVKYGDSLGVECRMPEEEENAIWGWVNKLRQQMRLHPPPSQVVGWLPVNVQPDAHSCSVFAVNAIEAFIGSRCLIRGTVNAVTDYRIELALRIIGVESTPNDNVRNLGPF